MAEKLPESINFPLEETAVLELWKELDVFKNCLKQSQGKPRYSFYDGPPFATGLPHYGHILAGTIKDIVTRYAHQKGFHVERRFGWDTHGLPVEFEIDKALNITGPDDVMKMGIANYNKECRNIVMRYANEWETIVKRLGRWIDFENDYKTLYPWYMESIWWVFKQLFDKGLVYQGVKVMPFSTGCNTPLSNFESGQNYKDVVDPSVVVSFPLDDEPGVHMLAWTTTPWTLPSNLAICCNPNFEYIEILDHKSNKTFILLESSLSIIYKSPDLYTVKGKRQGSDLLGKTYEPIFPYFAHLKEKGAFRVLNDLYVTAESGTGVVHQAPYFGEDDYRCCLKAGIITKDQESICPVNSSGCFTEPVTDFLGKYVKTADKEIIKNLQSRGRLIHSGTSKHSYPYCWRSDTPLIYKAVPSWFIKVESIKEKLLEASAQTYWVPDYVKEKRFGNWLRDARDWAISRNRYWGNPMPLWISEDRKEVVCIGCIAELERLTGKKITDIHRESIDDLEIPSSRPGQPPLRRVPEVFDCWFESGSMPYAQMHYPFENTKEFEESFPADFIAEGIDQTRGWFYTLLVISTALFGRPPYKNLIANGLILASDGQKMSKRKRNYPDPMEVVTRYGADALRLYLINSPVVRAENLRFKEEGVRDVVKDVLLPWYNAFRFLLQNVERFERAEKRKFVYKPDELVGAGTDNLMDRWILSFTESLLQFIETEMKAYRLYTVVPRLVHYIENLTNWYVRMNRRRLKGESGPGECERALNALCHVLHTMTRINAPFTPFLAEFMHRRLRPLLAASSELCAESVHYLQVPAPRLELVDLPTESAVTGMQSVIELGRLLRDRRTMPLKYPLPEVVVIHQDRAALDELRTLEPYVLDELNVRKLTLTHDKKAYGVRLRAEPEHRSLGSKYKADFRKLTELIRQLSDSQLQDFLRRKSIELSSGHVIEESELRILFTFDGPRSEELRQRYEAECRGSLLVLLDCTQSEEMLNEGLAREFVNRVQKLRKKAKLQPHDPARLYFEFGKESEADQVAKAVDMHKDLIESTTKTPQFPVSAMQAGEPVLEEEKCDLKGVTLRLLLVSAKNQSDKPKYLPEASKYVNVELTSSLQPRYGAKSRYATLWLQDRLRGDAPLSFGQLKQEVARVFGIHGCHYDIYDSTRKILNDESDILSYHKSLLSVVKTGENCPESSRKLAWPACCLMNVSYEKAGKKVEYSVFLENPKQSYVLDQGKIRANLAGVLSNSDVNVPNEPIDKLNGFVLNV
ncbi:hypothetical protein TKK_0004222 [Trichogramma kaykai]|uniref:Isoleucine--tRNA ligase, cytoplasmic n=1 Tax=Trichogramma kaykai TaxID=54128 RepID=A0ABD2XMM0_9HYME